MAKKTDKTNSIRQIASERPGPEKAGVGGSTPSRGTIKSATNNPLETIPLPFVPKLKSRPREQGTLTLSIYIASVAL
jgi:hypothetical protein